jgi:hypothetical protein
MKIGFRLSVVVLTLVAATMPVVGQQGAAHPDFSGTWKLNEKKSDLSGKSPLAGETIVITCNGLTIEMKHASVIDGHEVVQSFIADGQPRTVKETPRIEIETKAFWEKSSLVVVKTTHQSILPNKSSAVITSRWVLSKDGRMLKSELSMIGFSHNYVYDKQ